MSIGCSRFCVIVHNVSVLLKSMGQCVIIDFRMKYFYNNDNE